jgi:hypothetical protein
MTNLILPFKVRVHKLSKYFGECQTEAFTKNRIHEEEYIFSFSNYTQALERYKKECGECAEQCSMSISFSQTYTIQLIDEEMKNPLKSHNEKYAIAFQLTMSNL